jgi:integrase
LALQWSDVDLEAGTARTQAEDNKGKRDAIIGIHAVVVEHLRKIRGFRPEVFPWLQNARDIWPFFHEIQEAAGIAEPYYGFHDLRRGFATVNAENMTADALQRLMQHRSYTTTQRYINLAHQVKAAVANLHVPDVLRQRNA